MEEALWEGDPIWREKLRPNLTGEEAALFVIYDIAKERQLLAKEMIELRKAVEKSAESLVSILTRSAQTQSSATANFVSNSSGERLNVKDNPVLRRHYR